MATASSSLECPVCNEEFGQPKLLACNHVVCKKCILDWLQKAGHSGGCPLCHASILSSSSSPPTDDVKALVDALPTDLVIVAKVESQQIVASRDVCMSCASNTAADSFCFQCKMKLCGNCAKSHKRIPALKNHLIEDLSQLTAERVAAVPRFTCQSHDDRLAEQFCSTHRLLICSLCSSTTHRQCLVHLIQQAAVKKREELKQQAVSLRDKETYLRTKIKKTKDKFADMRTQANIVFDDLQQRVERQRQRVLTNIQAEEDKMALSQLDTVRAAVTSQAGVLENLLESATDDVLLDMFSSQESRLQQLQQQVTSTDSIQDPADVRVDSHQLTQLKTAIAALGQQGPLPTPPPPTSSTPPVPSAASGSTATTPQRTQLAGQQGPSPPPPPPTSSTPPVPSAASGSTATTPQRTQLGGQQGPSPLAHPLPTSSTPPAASVSTGTTPQQTQLGGQQGPPPPPPPPTSPTPPKSPSTSMTTATKPRGAALARVLKVGDRVKPNPDYPLFYLLRGDRGRQGTVTAVPSRLASSRGRDPTGWVDVKWDGGGKECCYCMGCEGWYYLDLV